MNFWEILILFFSFQALVLALLFGVRKKGDRFANGILAIFLLLFAYNLFFNVLYWSRFNTDIFATLAYTYFIPLSLYGTLFYFYIRRISIGTGIRLKDIVHFLPIILILFFFGPFYITPLEDKISILTSGDLGFILNSTYWIAPTLVLIMLWYALYSFLKFIRGYKNDPELAIWLKAISFAFVSFTLSHVLYRILVLSSIIHYEYDYFITIVMIFLIGLVCYFAFVHASIFNGTPIKKVLPFVKYEKTGLSKEFSLEMREKLLHLMEKEKPYLNPEIRLDSLGNLLDVSRHHASQIINEHFSMNFFDFINHYRIKEAERLLSLEKSQLSITDIAYQSGFNNRISFYKAFKKILGTTPSEYREHTLAS